jgi:hypothetical protein
MDMFNDLDLLLITKFAVGELLLGIVLGVVFKQVMKFDASKDINCQILDPKSYSSIKFGKFSPRHFGDAFLLPPEFILVKSLKG